MTPTAISNYIARMRSMLQTDMAFLDAEIKSNKNDTDQAIRLSWDMAHLHTSFTDFYRDLERIENELKKDNNAGTKIQDTIRRNHLPD